MEMTDDQFKRYMEEIGSAPDRAAAITAAAYLDDMLTNLLKTALRKDKDAAWRILKPTGPLGATFNKALLGYLLRIYNKDTLDDIESITFIRNEFAHKPHEMTFGTKQIRLKCEGLHINKVMVEQLGIKKPFENHMARFCYMSAINSISFDFRARIKRPEFLYDS